MLTAWPGRRKPAGQCARSEVPANSSSEPAFARGSFVCSCLGSLCSLSQVIYPARSTCCSWSMCVAPTMAHSNTPLGVSTSSSEIIVAIRCPCLRCRSISTTTAARNTSCTALSRYSGTPARDFGSPMVSRRCLERSCSGTRFTPCSATRRSSRRRSERLEFFPYVPARRRRDAFARVRDLRSRAIFNGRQTCVEGVMDDTAKVPSKRGV